MKINRIYPLFVTALFLVTTISVNAQTVLWAKKGISPGFENGNAIVVDDSGNVYVTGQIEFTSVFDTYSLPVYGQHDVVVAKYDTYGNIVWIRKAGGGGGDIGNGIGIDEDHNVYVTGEFEDTAKFGHITKTSEGGNDGFLAKYDVNGNIQWVKDFGTATGSEKGRAIAVSPSGNCYITGNFSNTTEFGGISLSTNGGNDIFIVKYDTNGDVDWAKKAGGSSQDRGYGIAIDQSENVFVTGTFTSSATFKNTTINNSGLHSTFLAKYDSNGSFDWVVDAGDCCDTTKASAVALDEDGNIYIAGYFMDEADFGSIDLNSWGSSDIFVVKYDPNGDVEWAKQAGGIDEDGAYGIAVDNSNEMVYVTGLVRENGYFDNIYYNIQGYKDVFIAAYTFDGDVAWAKTYGGNYRDVGNAIAVDKNGYIYNTGLFNDVAPFGPFTLVGYPNQPWADFYTDKIQPPMASAPTVEASALAIVSGNCSDLEISFVRGNGNKRLVIAREGFAVNAFPVDGNSYIGNAEFGNGTDMGNGNYVIYSGDDNDVTLTGLTPGSIYYFAVYEYNGGGVAANYLVGSPLTGIATAASFPLNVSGLQNSICIGSSLNLQANGASTYTWSPATGLSATTGANIIASPQITTRYTLEGITSQGCPTTEIFTIQVNNIPQLTYPTMNSTCINNAPFLVSGASPTGGTYSGAGINAGIFNPANAGIGNFVVQYDYTDGNGCSNSIQSSIRVNSVPSVSMGSLSPVCSNASPVILTIGIPSGGVYSGTGVNGGTFNPSVGAGTYTINYVYTDGNGCSETASSTILVQSVPTVNLGNDMIVCAFQSVPLSAGSGFSSYTWSTGATTPSITVDSSGVGLGSKNIFVIVSNLAGCQSSSTIQITFDLCAGINSPVTDLQGTSVFPNPFREFFSLSSENKVTMNVYDMTGRILESRENISGTIVAGESLSPGMYLIEVSSGTNRKVFPVIKSE
jgi:hypothetical protein